MTESASTHLQFDLEHRLSIFIREEVLLWAQMSKTDPRNNLRELVLNNVDSVVRRAKVMSCKMEREKVSRVWAPDLFGWMTDQSRLTKQPPSPHTPVNQSILELLLQATSAQNLSRMEPIVSVTRSPCTFFAEADRRKSQFNPCL